MRELVPRGVWEMFVPDARRGRALQVRDPDAARGTLLQKADPYAFGMRAAAAHRVDRRTTSPGTTWHDDEWMAERARGATAWLDRPMSIYEVHLGSWRAEAGDGQASFLTYRELAEQLVPYVQGPGLHAHRAAAGHGAPVRRIVGLPGHRLLRADQPLRLARRLQAFRRRVPPGRHRRDPRLGAGALPEGRARPRALRRHGALRARRPAPGRAPGLGHAHLQLRPQRGPQLPARATRCSGSSEFHIDGLRVDAVASMLYLDYSRQARRVDPEPVRRPREPRGDRLPAAAQHARRTTSSPASITIAEESTAWPGVSRPVHLGGLGFTYKWNMGWMHDIAAATRRAIRCTAGGTTTS